jgi:hypothetical protein
MRIGVEDKSSGIGLIQAMISTGLPIFGIKTGMDSKSARALNTVGERSAGSVQGWFRQHRVRFPFAASWKDTLEAELKDFSGQDDASSDQVDALVHLVTHAIKIGSNSIVLPSDMQGSERSAGGVPAPQEQSSDLFSMLDANTQFFASLGSLPDMAVDPYEGTCGRCHFFENKNTYCAVYKAKRLAMDSCQQFELKTSLMPKDLIVNFADRSNSQW